MKPGHGWTDYQQRLGRVIAYVHDHLDEPLDLNRLAEVAHLSPHHWHRVCHALHGETIAATVRRLRLHRATGDLANKRWRRHWSHSRCVTADPTPPCARPTSGCTSTGW